MTEDLYTKCLFMEKFTSEIFDTMMNCSKSNSRIFTIEDRKGKFTWSVSIFHDGFAITIESRRRADIDIIEIIHNKNKETCRRRCTTSARFLVLKDADTLSGKNDETYNIPALSTCSDDLDSMCFQMSTAIDEMETVAALLLMPHIQKHIDEEYFMELNMTILNKQIFNDFIESFDEMIIKLKLKL